MPAPNFDRQVSVQRSPDIAQARKGGPNQRGGKVTTGGGVIMAGTTSSASVPDHFRKKGGRLKAQIPTRQAPKKRELMGWGGGGGGGVGGGGWSVGGEGGGACVLRGRPPRIIVDRGGERRGAGLDKYIQLKNLVKGGGPRAITTLRPGCEGKLQGGADYESL